MLKIFDFLFCRIVVNGDNNILFVNGVNNLKRSRDSSPASSTTSSSSATTPDTPIITPDTPPLSKEELRSVRLRNQNMRQMIHKEVKRPGQNHGKLFSMLKDLVGPKAVRVEYIGEVVQEARRFKRRSLADLLVNKTEELVK